MSTRSLWSIWLGDETKRSGGFLQQQQRLRARLTQEVLSQTQLRAWVLAGVSSEHLVMRLKLVEKLAGMINPGHLALVPDRRRVDVFTTNRTPAWTLHAWSSAADKFTR